MMNALVSYTPAKKIVDLNVEVMFEDELTFLAINVMDAPIKMSDNDKFVWSRSGKRNRRRLRKMMNKLERMTQS